MQHWKVILATALLTSGCGSRRVTGASVCRADTAAERRAASEPPRQNRRRADPPSGADKLAPPAGAAQRREDPRGGADKPAPPAEAPERREDPSARPRGTEDVADRKPRRARPRRGAGVKAGAADDNVQFNAYLRFLAQNRGRGLPFPAERRRVVRVVDAKDRPWPGARLTLVRPQARQQRAPIRVRRTYSDGRALFFAEADGLHVRVEVDGQPERSVALGARRAVDIRIDAERPTVREVPLDVAFVLDTTGSMQDEIDQLRSTLDAINFQISHASPPPDVRYGLVLYRDREDAYRTRTVPLTRDLAAFSRRLGRVSAGGGDDYPEDVQAGLKAALRGLDWRESGVRVAFLIGDAPPHLDYGQSYTYLTAADEAATRGIKITTIGASGLNRTGEVVWRQIAQQTMAPFVFLTYGETGDAEGGPSSVSHHVGANWVADDLDAIVVRLVKQELAHWRPGGAPTRADYFIAKPSDRASPDEVLEELFRQSVQQLVDYAIEALEPRTPTVVLPLRDDDEARARRLQRRLAVGLSRQGRFQLVERARRQAMLRAVAEQMAQAYDEERMVEVGKLVPARLAVIGAVDPGDEGQIEVLLRLVRLETGEILSLSLLRIAGALL